jgi:hypothetical protein
MSNFALCFLKDNLLPYRDEIIVSLKVGCTITRPLRRLGQRKILCRKLKAEESAAFN